MRFPRSSGILLHPTSLPGPYGIGDLGPEAYRFADFLVESGQSLWQLLPLGPTGFGDSPYQCLSAFAGNPLLISPDLLANEGLLSREDLRACPLIAEGRVDFETVIQLKKPLLERAFENYVRSDRPRQGEVADFRCGAAAWIEDYALFRALKDSHDGRAWNEWPALLIARDPAGLSRARAELAKRVEANVFFQYLFFKQWGSLKRYCGERGVAIVGDLPIFVAYDSADVWAHRALFKLNPDATPTVVAGVPPDYFSATGQLWGNPVYDWEKLRATGYGWWIDRMRAAFQMFDIVRIDHFRGFAACWEVPYAERTAQRGRWVEAPGHEIFAALESSLGRLPIVAEDLGLITPDVEQLRRDSGFPGMRVLQFAFGADPDNTNLPHNFDSNSVVYTGTHDNDTTVGWFDSLRSAQESSLEREFCLEYLGSNGQGIHWDFIRAAMASVADVAIVPAQDLLGLGSEARMNLPSSPTGNWTWRLRSGELTGALADRLGELTRIYGRAGSRRLPRDS